MTGYHSPEFHHHDDSHVFENVPGASIDFTRPHPFQHSENPCHIDDFLREHAQTCIDPQFLHDDTRQQAFGREPFAALPQTQPDTPHPELQPFQEARGGNHPESSDDETRRRALDNRRKRVQWDSSVQDNEPQDNLSGKYDKRNIERQNQEKKIQFEKIDNRLKKIEEIVFGAFLDKKIRFQHQRSTEIADFLSEMGLRPSSQSQWKQAIEAFQARKEQEPFQEASQGETQQQQYPQEVNHREPPKQRPKQRRKKGKSIIPEVEPHEVIANTNYGKAHAHGKEALKIFKVSKEYKYYKSYRKKHDANRHTIVQYVNKYRRSLGERNIRKNTTHKDALNIIDDIRVKKLKKAPFGEVDTLKTRAQRSAERNNPDYFTDSEAEGETDLQISQHPHGEEEIASFPEEFGDLADLG